MNQKVDLQVPPAPVWNETKSEELWNALINRDPSYRDSFVYSVSSTGIYCRPDCASKRPDRKQVTFFHTSIEAREAGFRACLRCKPDQTRSGIRLIRDLCRFIEEEASSKITLAVLAERAGISPFHLQRIFKKELGISPRQYLERVRLQKMRISLRNGDSTRNATYKAGYNSSSWLYPKGSARFGMNPSEYKRAGEGKSIDYVITDCRLGRLLVATTDRGVCAVSLGDSDERLVSFLKEEYSKAVISRENEGGASSEWLEEVKGYIETGKDLSLSGLPTDVSGTAFQDRVWREIQKIPFGSVRTYGEIARRINNPKGSRAVANACASNPVALVIPCHRVVRGDGEMGGYRWGKERKKKLLEIEKADVWKGIK